MKRTFLRRNLFIGVLMGLVMVLGVQESADAITRITKTASRDHQVVSINQEFTITFSVGVTSPRLKAGHKSVPSGATTGGTTIDRSANPYYIDTGDPGHQDEAGVTRAAAHNYDEEAIAISSDTPTLTLRKGSTSLTLGASERSLSEDATERDLRLSSSVTLKGVATAAGKYVITIEDVTAAADFPSDTRPSAHTPAPTTTFTIYVWQNVSTSRGSIIATGLSNGIAEQYGTEPLRVVLSGTSSDFAKVEFEVTRGPGRLYEDKNGDGKADKSASKRLTTFTSNGGTEDTAEVVLMPNRGTSHIRAWVSGNAPDPTKTHTTEAIYSYGYSQLKKVSGDKQRGPASSRLEKPFVVQLVDSTGRTTIPGADITFTTTGATLEKDPSFPDDLYATAFPTPATVTTDSNGRANVFLVMDTTDASVTVTFSGDTSGSVMFTAEIGRVDPRTPQTVEIMPGTDGQRANKYGVLEKALAVIVRDQYGARLPGIVVEFEARDGGDLSNPMLEDPGIVPTSDTDPTLDDSDSTERRRDIITDNSGEASVRYLAAEKSGAQRVTATLEKGSRRFKTFTINGPASARIITVNTGDDDDDEEEEEEGTITVDPTSLRGETGARVSLTVDPSTIPVTITGSAFTSAGGLFVPTQTSATRNLILPNTAASYTLTLSARGYEPVDVPVTVTGPSQEPSRTASTSGTLSVSGPISGAPGTAISVTVRARDTANAAVGSLSIRLTADAAIGTLAQTSVVTNASGVASTVLTLSSTPGATGFVRASASRYTDNGGRRFSVSTTTDTRTDTEEEEEEEETVSEPASIEVSGPSTRSGPLNTQLEASLLVQVLDGDDESVEDARVTFRLKKGDGRLDRPGETSQRGDGKATIVRTDTRGYARVDFTPRSATSTVEASVRGVTKTAIFTITATGSAPSRETQDTGDTTPSTDDTSRITVSPVLNTAVDAASRPPALWISGGKIYALVGSEVKEFITDVKNARNIAVGRGKVYWTAQTSDTRGTLHSANLDGTGAKELRSLWGAPRGIAVDTANSKLYWVDAANRLQSSNLKGENIKNVLRNLSDPQDIVLAGSNVYWIGNGSGTDTLSFINLTDPKKVIHPVAATSGTYGGLAITGNKVYWTEQTSDTHGTLHSANLDGTGEKELRTDPIWGAPVGIAVDTARSKLYWTDAVGRLQRANLDGSGIHNVAKGLGRPGDMVLSNSIQAPTGTTTTTGSGKGKYDVNGDGKVDVKDSDMLLLAVTAGITDAKYDVNGDGKVDINDIVDVTANRDKGAASAPALLGTKFTAVERDRLQEQIDLLIATGDRSPAALKTLIYLQQLLVMARPEKTQLLANYPNPFNPETWIPYELATDTDVRITIYNAQGVVIRTLHLGQQSAGYYTDRERAAYWDGRNALGEQVASGVYFYQLETDEISSLRKMVILK